MLGAVKDAARRAKRRGGLRPSLSAPVRGATLACGRDEGMVNVARTKGLFRMRSCWHGGFGDKRLAMLQDSETDHQQFAHCCDHDLLALQAALFAQSRH